MPNSLFEQTVESTYEGVLHANGRALPEAGNTRIYDGYGNASTLMLGICGASNTGINGGLTITGNLSTGNIEFTNVDSLSGEGYPLISNGAGRVDFGQIIPEALRDLDPNPEGTYSQIDQITVNSKGLVTDVVQSALRTCWVNFNGVPIHNIGYEVVDVGNNIISCQKVGHGLANGQVISVTAQDALLNGQYPVTVYNDDSFSFPLPAVLQDPTGYLSVTTTIRSSFNVKQVYRTQKGGYFIRFNESYNNNMYMTQVTKGNHLQPIVNPEVPPAGYNGYAIVTYQDVSGVGVYSQNGDCDNMNVLTMGNTSIYVIDEPQGFPVQFSQFEYKDLYFNIEMGEASAGKCSIVAPETPYVIDADYMAKNKFLALEIPTLGLDHCRDGYFTFEHRTAITDLNGATYLSKFRMNTGFSKKYGWVKYSVVTLIFYIDNKLYCKNLYANIPASLVDTNSQYDLRTPDANIPPPIPKIPRRTICLRNLAGQGTSKSYLTGILEKYGIYEKDPVLYPNGFRRISAITVNNKFTAAHNGACGGGFMVYKHFKKYYVYNPVPTTF